MLNVGGAGPGEKTMDKFLVRGGRPLKGKIEIGGAKNSALPCLAATLLTPETVTLHNVPYVKDLITQRRLLEDLGATVLTPELRTHKVTAKNVAALRGAVHLVKTMRASVLALGPLLARFGQAKVSLPGGCAIGTRPIDLHLKAFEQLGATVSLESGDVVARAPKGRLIGADVDLKRYCHRYRERDDGRRRSPTGKTTISNAAQEPEIEDLAELLNKMGARIKGAGTSDDRDRGRRGARRQPSTRSSPTASRPARLSSPRRSPAASLEIKSCSPEHSRAVIEENARGRRRDRGAQPEHAARQTQLTAGLKANDVTTEPHPQFPDRHAGAVHGADDAGRGDVDDHRNDLREPFHARVRADPNGGGHSNLGQHGDRSRAERSLTGAPIIASDLRASASLVLAALCAEGETLIDRVYHIDRGYETIVRKLRSVGADIERCQRTIVTAGGRGPARLALNAVI